MIRLFESVMVLTDPQVADICIGEIGRVIDIQGHDLVTAEFVDARGCMRGW